LAPFNSQIKIHDDKFFIIDFSNTLRCFSIKDGNELWNIKTENSLIRSQKKLSMTIIDEKIYFNNSVGDISAVDLSKGELLWQLPTQSNLIYESAFSLQTSDIISDKENLFFSNNNNEFFSINIQTGSFNWKNKINSNLRSTIVDNLIFSVSLEGYLIILDKRSGNIIRVTDVFQNFKLKKRSKIKPTGFIVGLSKVYISTSNGKLIVIDILSGKISSILKIDNKKISKPFIKNKNLYLIKDSAIIRLN
jgi:outer membrane protein assembly factor BamB